MHMIDISTLTIGQIASLKATVDAAHAALAGLAKPVTAPKPAAAPKLARKPRVPRGENSALSTSIVAALTGSEPVSSDRLAADLGEDIGLVRKVLKTLIGSNVVVATGAKRGTKYSLCSATTSTITSE